MILSETSTTKSKPATCRTYASLRFMGDRLDPDGNDYPVKALGVPTKAVAGWEETAEFIAEFLAK